MQNIIGGASGGDYLLDILGELGLSSYAVSCIDISDPRCYTGSGQRIYDSAPGTSLQWALGSTTNTESGSYMSDPGYVSAGMNSYLSLTGTQNIGIMGITAIAGSAGMAPLVGPTAKSTWLGVYQFNTPGNGATATIDYFWTSSNWMQIIHDSTGQVWWDWGLWNGGSAYYGSQIAFTSGVDSFVMFTGDMATKACKSVQTGSSVVTSWTQSLGQTNSMGTPTAIEKLGSAFAAQPVSMVGRFYCGAWLSGVTPSDSTMLALKARLKTRFANI